MQVLANIFSVSAVDIRFSPPQLVGRSKTTHFWMAGIYPVVSTPAGTVLTVDENGDGTPATNCSLVHCEPRNYVAKTAGGPWNPLAAGIPGTNALIRFDNGTYRGFAGFTLFSGNTSGETYLTDWTFDGETAHTLQRAGARVSGLVRLAGRPLLMPSAVVLGDGTRLAFAYGRAFNASTDSSYLLASDDDGYSWSMRSRAEQSRAWHAMAMICYAMLCYARSMRFAFNRTAGMPSVAGCGGYIHGHPQVGPCGPCEPAVTLLPDGVTLLAVLRMESYACLWQSTSTDGGFTWSEPQETRAWAVFPQLKTLANGAVVLTAGRPSLGLWVLDVSSLEWSTFRNLAAAHNAGLPSPPPAEWAYDALETEAANCSSTISWPPLTKAYTALDALPCDGDGACSVIVAYDRTCNGNGLPPGPNGAYDRVFTMEVSVEV